MFLWLILCLLFLLLHLTSNLFLFFHLIRKGKNLHDIFVVRKVSFQLSNIFLWNAFAKLTFCLCYWWKIICTTRFLDVLHEAPLFGHRKPTSIIGSVFYCFLLASIVYPFSSGGWLGKKRCSQFLGGWGPSYNWMNKMSIADCCSIVGRLCYFGSGSSMDIASSKKFGPVIALQLWCCFFDDHRFSMESLPSKPT